jgi:hypothetical protein
VETSIGKRTGGLMLKTTPGIALKTLSACFSVASTTLAGPRAAPKTSAAGTLMRFTDSTALHSSIESGTNDSTMFGVDLAALLVGRGRTRRDRHAGFGDPRAGSDLPVLEASAAK